MADEQEAKQTPAGEGNKKGGLKPVLFLVVGAVLGGAGVVVLLPSKEVVKVVGPPQPEFEQVELPDAMEVVFYPKVERGQKTMRISFWIVYRQDKHKEALVTESLKLNWKRAQSHCIEMLNAMPFSAVSKADSMQKLRAMLRDALSTTLFPDGIATVDDILWKKFEQQ